MGIIFTRNQNFLKFGIVLFVTIFSVCMCVYLSISIYFFVIFLLFCFRFCVYVCVFSYRYPYGPVKLLMNTLIILLEICVKREAAVR